MIYLVIILILSYLVGSIPTSIIIGKVLRGIDIREHGSGNAGGTNAFRVLGWKPALVVVIVDVFKGWFATAYISKEIFQNLPISDVPTIQILCGFAAVLGHSYTIFAGFRGGKGIGALAGMLIALFAIAFPLCLLVFVIALTTTGFVSVGSISASISLPIFLYILPKIADIQPAPLSLEIFSLLIPIFVIFTHRSNIKRLLKGTENRFEKAIIFRRQKES